MQAYGVHATAGSKSDGDYRSVDNNAVPTFSRREQCTLCTGSTLSGSVQNCCSLVSCTALFVSPQKCRCIYSHENYCYKMLLERMIIGFVQFPCVLCWHAAALTVSDCICLEGGHPST